MAFKLGKRSSEERVKTGADGAPIVTQGSVGYPSAQATAGADGAPVASRKRRSVPGIKAPGSSRSDAASVPGMEAVRDLDSRPAFEMRDAPLKIDASVKSMLFAEDNRRLRRMVLVGVLVLVVLFFATLSIPTTRGMRLYTPLEVLQALWLHVEWGVGSLFGHTSGLTYYETITQYPAYYEVETRFNVSVITVVCGLLLALSGSLYQMVFKNPIAAPTMLGVTNGITAGVLVLVLQFEAAAVEMTAERYVYCVIGAIAVLFIVLLISRLTSGRGSKFSTMQLLLSGAIVSQVIGTIVQVIADSFMSDDLWDIYETLNQGMYIDTGLVALISVVIALAAGVIPIYLMRTSVNMVSYTEEEARLSGVDMRRMSLVCLICGTVMIIIAQVNAGTVSMVALVVPFLSRALFGTEFRHQFWGDVLMGALVLLVCRYVQILFPFFGMQIPIGAIVSFALLPLYVWVIVSNQRGWD